MKKSSILLVLLFVLLALAGCVDGETPYSDVPPSGNGNGEQSNAGLNVGDNGNGEASNINLPAGEYGNGEAPDTDLPTGEYVNGMPPGFNLPTIEGPYDFRVRYFGGSWYPSRHMREINRDFYAEEIATLQANPGALERTWRTINFTPELWHATRAPEISVITSMDELDGSRFAEEEYTQEFFESNYLVVVTLPVITDFIAEKVYGVEASGRIVFRPIMTASRPEPHTIGWNFAVVIELDNRFQPREFYVAFICNPWAEGCCADVRPEDLFNFNVSTIESPYDYRIRYIGWTEHEDFYAEEREFLQKHPAALEYNWENRVRGFAGWRIVTSMDDPVWRNSPNWPEHNEYFFENHYLVLLEFRMPTPSLDCMVFKICENGVIWIRPRIGFTSDSMLASDRTIILELDNRFQVHGVRLIGNPWAPYFGLVAVAPILRQ